MNWNDHSKLEGKHATLNPSGYSWLNYADNPELLHRRFVSRWKPELGTILHEYAMKRIKYKLKLTKSSKSDALMYIYDHGIPVYLLNHLFPDEHVLDLEWIFPNLVNYVNDAIGFRMDPEIVLYFSDHCYGTADAISYSKKNKELRIHDLKTGETPAHMEQLLIYASLFCLEYGIKPTDISCELRIYQGNDIQVYEPTVNDIAQIIDQIVSANRIVETFVRGD